MLHGYRRTGSPVRRRLLAGTALAGGLTLLAAGVQQALADPLFVSVSSSSSYYKAIVSNVAGSDPAAPAILIQAPPGFITPGWQAGSNSTSISSNMDIDLTAGTGASASTFGPIIAISGSAKDANNNPIDPSAGIPPGGLELGSGNVHVVLAAGSSASAGLSDQQASSGLNLAALVGISGTGNVDIENDGSVVATGEATGVLAFSGTGNVHVHGGTAKGTVEAAKGTAVSASTGYGLDQKPLGTATSDVRIDDIGDIGGVVAGAGKGIDANNGGTGRVVIARIGAVTAGKTAIEATANGGDVAIGVDPAHAGGSQAMIDADRISHAVSGATGISATTSGDGSIHIATGAGGTVTGATKAGIEAFVNPKSGNGSGSVVVDVGAAVIGATYGVKATTNASGSVTVDGSGDVSGAVLPQHAGDLDSGTNKYVYGNGIGAFSYGGSATVSGAGKTTATGHGTAIDASVTMGSGSVRISRSGDVSAEDGIGINARHDGTGNIVLAGIGSVTSTGSYGIRADANGGGGLFIGVDPSHDGSGSDVKATDRLKDVSGTTGISAWSQNGEIRVATGTGKVTGSRQAGIEVYLWPDNDQATSAAVSVDIGAGGVSGRTAGVVALNQGSGSLDVGGEGDVEGQTFTGEPDNWGVGRGIYAESKAGSITVSGTGKTKATGGGAAISAIVRGGAGPIRISRSGDVSAGNGIGINAQNDGTGNVVVAGIGKVTSAGGTAILASAKGGDVTIGVDPADDTDAKRQASKLSRAISGTSGINASASGAGSIRIATRAGGTVTGTAIVGISTGAEAGLTEITLGAEVSGRIGVRATSTTGNITVTSAAAITGLEGKGISATSGGVDDHDAAIDGGNIDIGGTNGLGGAVSADNAGISATTTGSGTIAVKTASGGKVTSVYNSGIFTSAGAGATTITLGAAVSGRDAVYASSTTGAITLTSSAAITGIGGAGILAGSEGGTIDIGGEEGLGGAITGTTGIKASINGDGDVTIRIGSGGSVTGTGTTPYNAAILASVDKGTATIEIGDGATVTGAKAAILLGALDHGVGIVDNSGTIRGSITAKDLGQNHTATFTLANSGTIVFGDGQSVTGFGTLQNQSGGVLTGTGDFGDVHAASGSYLKPGNRDQGGDIGTMTVGALTMDKGSTLEVRARLLPSGAGFLVGDKVSAKTAVLNDAVIQVLGSPSDGTLWKAGVNYTVITATDGVSGTVSAKTNLAFLTPTASIVAKTVSLGLAPNGSSSGGSGGTGGSGGSTDVGVILTPTPAGPARAQLGGPNQTAVYDVLHPFQSKAPSSAAGQKLVDQFNNITADSVQKAVEQLSGSSSTGGQVAAAAASTAFSGNVMTQTLAAGGVGGSGAPSIQGSNTNAAAYADDASMKSAALKAATPKGATKAAPSVLSPASAASWRLWATGLGAQSTTEARAASPRVTGNDWGLAAGLDTILNPNVTVGLALGGTSSRFSVDHGATTGTTDGGHASLYGIATMDAFYVAGSLGYGRLQTRAVRTITALGSPEHYDGKYATDAFTGQAEVGYRMALQGFVLTPFAGLQATLLHQHSYAETSATPGAVAGLAYAAQDTWSVPGQLGVQAEHAFALEGGWRLTAQARVAWVHEFGPDRKATSSFVALPGSSFSVKGVAATENLARLTGGLTLANDKGTSLFATLTSDVASHARTYAAQGGVKVEW